MQLDTPDEHLETGALETDATAVNDSVPAGADTGSTVEADGADDGPKSMLDAVLTAVGQKAEGADAEAVEEPPAPSEPEPKVDAKAEPAELSAADAAEKEVVDPDYVPPEEWKQYGPKARKRIERLRHSKIELERELSEVRPIAQTVREYEFSQEDVEATFGAMKLIRTGRFKEFLEAVQPYVALAQEAIGEKLPDDLQQQVDDGYTTHEIAAELARTRHQAEMAKSQIETVQQRQVAQTQEAGVQRIAASVSEWENQIRLRDPDYARKAELVQREAKRLMLERGKPPQSVEDALSLAKQAYEEANKIVATLAPTPRQSTRPSPQGSARIPGTVRAEPRNMMEAIEMGLARA